MCKSHGWEIVIRVERKIEVKRPSDLRIYWISREKKEIPKYIIHSISKAAWHKRKQICPLLSPRQPSTLALLHFFLRLWFYGFSVYSSFFCFFFASVNRPSLPSFVVPAIARVVLLLFTSDKNMAFVMNAITIENISASCVHSYTVHCT